MSGQMRVTGSMWDDASHARTVRIVTEMRAEELRQALRHAVAGSTHWRLEAQMLLDEIANGVLPELCP